jgi:hypothetical protein
LSEGLEDCLTLSELIRKSNKQWNTITNTYNEVRKANIDAVSELSKQYFESLLGDADDNEHITSQAIISYIQKNYNDIFESQY